jgi:two-component system, chemotaxis family, sensor histidine kinase and response regulator PixL
MAIDPDIRDQAYQFFVEEAPELLQILEAGLLTLRQERSTAKVHDLMRSAHSIKGGASSVGLDAIATLAHHLENVFKALYSEALAIDADLESQLLQAYDCLRMPLMEQITTGAFDQEAALAIADPIFSQLEERCGDTLLHADSYLPSSADLGVDMISAIFEVDVAQGLERLAAVVSHPQEYEVAGELRAQVEVFEGFAEFLNLPEFGAIAKTVQQALAAHPNRALEIARLALADFECSRQAVLENNRKEIGPSATLMALADADSANRLDRVASHEIQPIPEAEGAIEEVAIALSLLQNTFGSTDSIAEALQPTSSSEIATPSDFNSLQSQYLAELDSTETLETVDASVRSIDPILDPSRQNHPSSTFQENLVGNPVDHDPEQSQVGQLVRLNKNTDGTLQVSQFAELSPPDQASQEPIYSQQIEAPAAPNLTVRVDAERLERMNNLVGELTINRDGLSLQSDQLQKSLKELRNRFSQFQKMVHHLGKLSDQMLIAPEHYHPSGKSGSEKGEPPKSAFTDAHHSALSSFTSTKFDPLEMDNYGALQSQVQAILESMMQMEETVEDITLFSKQPHQTLIQQRRMLTHLRDEIMRARMLPMGEVLNRFHRVLRDLSTTHYKSVGLTLIGTEVLVEKAILEKLYDPLLHLLRNAFDHGIEPLEVRRQRGKPEQGQIVIRAYHSGNQTIIEFKDDGQGLNLERIQKRALELGWLSPEQLAVTPPSRLCELIFEPGFSTTHQVSRLSGRGVGLDVVRSQLRLMKGKVTVASSSEQGTTFTLHLPLTLTIANLAICLIGTTALALPTDSIEEIVTPKAGETRQSGAQRFLYWQEKIIPIYRLANLVDYSCPLPDIPSSKSLIIVPSPKTWELPVLILRQEQQIFAVEVDSLVTEQELVIKPFSTTLAPPVYAYGCTILADGRLVPVIDSVALLSLNQEQSKTTIALTDESEPLADSTNQNSSVGKHSIVIKTAQTPTILVIDDAASLRRTLALTLKREGFRVLQAQDGWEAIDQLQKSSSVELVICDIEMPNMNGFEFLNYRRQDPQLSNIPIVMLTSRTNEKHRWLAMQLGATAYFTKPYLEQEFLAALKNILNS